MSRSCLFWLLLAPALIAQQNPVPPGGFQQNSEVEAKGLHGPVHTLVVQHKYDNLPDPQLEEEATYNEQGWLTELKTYGLDNQIMQHTIFKRDGRRMIESDATWFAPPENAKRIVTSFEEHGFPSQQVTYNLDGTVRERMTVIYEEKQIRELHYDGDRRLVTTRTISTLHNPNSPVRHIEQRANGKPEAITDLDQTQQGLEVKQRVYKDGQLDEQNVRDIRKDAAGSATLRRDGSASVVTSRPAGFDEMVNPDGSRMKSKFNEAGQRVEEDRYDSSGKLVEQVDFKYEDDDRGNWIRRITASSTDPAHPTVTIRNITYY